jgi:hypothetical protein
MAKVWFVTEINPLKLCSCGAATKRNDLLVVPLDAKPYGALERAKAEPVAFVVPKRKVVVLQLVAGGRYVEVDRPAILLGEAKPESIVFLPGDDGVWGAWLVLPAAKRDVDRPMEVDRMYWQLSHGDRLRHGRGAKKAGAHWATAWSIYCKYIEPGSTHCRKPRGHYLTG